MKAHLFLTHCLLAFLLIVGAPARLEAESTAFTYQGQLQNNGSPANGTYNFTFSLYTNSSGSETVDEDGKQK
jgi:hypothetical protein